MFTYKNSASIVQLLVGGGVAMETECLRLDFGVDRTQIRPLLDPKMLVIRMVSKTPHFLDLKNKSSGLLH